MEAWGTQQVQPVWHMGQPVCCMAHQAEAGQQPCHRQLSCRCFYPPAGTPCGGGDCETVEGLTAVAALTSRSCSL